MSDLANWIPWADTTCRTHVTLRSQRIVTERPAITVTEQRAWYEDFERWLRFTLKNMLPESRTVIEGISVRRYSGDFGHVLFYAVDNRKCDDFEAAVSAVVGIVNSRKQKEAG